MKDILRLLWDIGDLIGGGWFGFALFVFGYIGWIVMSVLGDKPKTSDDSDTNQNL
jgi:hypothetical protein